MINKMVLEYIIKNKIYHKVFVVPILFIVFLGIILSVLSGEIISAFLAFVTIFILVILMIWTEYNVLNRSEYVPTPLNVLDVKYSEIVNRHDEIDFLGINQEEMITLKGIIKEYEEAIDLLRTEK